MEGATNVTPRFLEDLCAGCPKLKVLHIGISYPSHMIKAFNNALSLCTHLESLHVNIGRQSSINLLSASRQCAVLTSLQVLADDYDSKEVEDFCNKIPPNLQELALFEIPRFSWDYSRSNKSGWTNMTNHLKFLAAKHINLRILAQWEQRWATPLLPKIDTLIFPNYG